ncbi:alpha-glucan family phosphorylase [Tellurirhabdus rosea]|uniref:alpha-glucan family phosphorylase n=1 Tax=Tellurirhabdus rosea TaxID=2674997 RepID=UPI00224D9DA4|nr:alpha-glucan family phosphorylase [Tellurirhabdus rosea]
MNHTALPTPYRHPYEADPAFRKSVAYFSMEFAIDQALKTYSGGLGFLAGSHMRSAFELKQNVIGISILWKYGYYDQDRNTDNTMAVRFREKIYQFLEDTGVEVTVEVQGRPVRVRGYFLRPDRFNTAPIFFLTTDVEGNDPWARSISYRLYDADVNLKVAQCMVLGLGGARFLEAMNYEPEVYHFNEAHAVSAVFHLYNRLQNLQKIRDRVVFTTHTPEEAGNEKHDIYYLFSMGFFAGIPLNTVMELIGQTDQVFNHSLTALRMSRRANAVSRLHGSVSRTMWASFGGVPEITHVTNAQNRTYWADPELEAARLSGDTGRIAARKKSLKAALFKIVADQTGRIFDPSVLTIVWARRFAGYKRPDLLVQDVEQFNHLVRNLNRPVQIIWAGKPYPLDEAAVRTFNHLHYLTYLYPNIAVLTGYELGLSKALKDGADIWLNTPVVTREASGTSGMTAAMNAALNFSTFDGWICEFARHGENSFLVPVAGADLSPVERDTQDRTQLYRILEKEIIPMYYQQPDKWKKLVLQSMNDVNAFFDSGRMATEYYEKVYQ